MTSILMHPGDYGGAVPVDSDFSLVRRSFRPLALTPGIHQRLWGLFLNTRNLSVLGFFCLAGGSEAKQNTGSVFKNDFRI